MCVKRVFTTTIYLFAVSALCNAEAQVTSAASHNAPDTVTLSTQTDGDYVVSRMLVKGGAAQSVSYDVMYPISKSVLVPAMNGNAAEIKEIADFVKELPTDTLRRVASVTLCGYASPDGGQMFNKRLAAARANDFAEYLRKNNSIPDGVSFVVMSHALTWLDSRDAIAKSSVPERDKVLAIIDSDASESQKEAQLRRMPASWRYLRESVLPTLRRADMEIEYQQSEVITVRRMVTPPPAVQRSQTVATSDTNKKGCCPCGENCPCEEIVIEEHITGIMVEMAGNPE